jgi:hypothetical protein
MRYVFVGWLLLGLLLGVRAMLHGVERPAKPRARAKPGTEASPRFTLNLPTAAGFATVFGLTGYLLTRYTNLGVAPMTAIAFGVGVIGALGALLLVAAWAIPAAKAEVPDERFALQGEFARVIGVSDRGTKGTVTYSSGGVSFTTPAAALEGTRLEVGSDVVIERIENGIAFVETWARVEARL